VGVRVSGRIFSVSSTLLCRRLNAAAKEIISRRAEIFPRISATALIRLAADAAAPRIDESIAAVASTGLTPRVVVVDASDVGSSDPIDRKLLIIDARTAEEFELVRLRDSLSFPLLKLRQDRGMPYPLIAARHAADKVVVCVDWEEGPTSEAVELVSKLVSTGWANAVLLSGGWRRRLRTQDACFPLLHLLPPSQE